MAAWGEDINHAWAKYYTANGVTEAEALELPAAAFTATVDRYNRAVAEGNDE